MKITKTQLREIIREEIQKLNEVEPDWYARTKHGKKDIDVSDSYVISLKGAPKRVRGSFFLWPQ